MLRVEEYLSEAQSLRRRAADESNEALKAALLKMADQYESLANQREAFLELQEEIRANIENRSGKISN